jgi:hypothetical protein
LPKIIGGVRFQGGFEVIEVPANQPLGGFATQIPITFRVGRNNIAVSRFGGSLTTYLGAPS